MSNIQLVQQQIELARPDFEANAAELKLNLSFQKEANFALQIFQGNNYLAKMSPDSIKNAIVNIALTGLTLNPVMKFAYLVPRKGKCVLDVSYMGLAKILTDTGSVKNIEANVVYWNEPFKLQRGTNPSIEHGIIESPGVQKGELRGAYSVATLNDGSKSIEWMDAAELHAISQRSESVKAGTNSPWKTDTMEMCRKTVIKRHYKYLPKSERAIMAATAIDIDHENNGIDFAAEQQEKQPEIVNIDVLDPSNSEVQEKYNPMMAAVAYPNVPDDAFGPGTNKTAFITEFKAKVESGRMPVQEAEGVFKTVLKYFPQAQPQQPQ